MNARMLSVLLVMIALVGATARAQVPTRPPVPTVPSADRVGARIDAIATGARDLPTDRRPMLVRQLASLGPEALDGMLSRLQTDSPAMAALRSSEGAYRAVRAALVEAVGQLEDPRSIPTLTAVLDGADGDERTWRAAATGLGRLCRKAGTASVLTARATAGHVRARAAIGGLGACRTEAGMAALVGQIADGDPALRTAVAEAIGMAGSSWAWKALGEGAAVEGAKVRGRALEALLATYPASQGEERVAITRAVLMLDLPGTEKRLVAPAYAELARRWSRAHRKE